MKRIISILLILLALSLTLGAVSAEEVAGDDVVAAADTAVVSADESESATGGSESAAGGEEATTTGTDVTAEATSNSTAADLAVDVEVIDETDDGEIIWGVLVTNYGPDTAVNTIAAIGGSDSLLLYDFIEGTGVFDPITCIWEIGDLAKDEQAILLLGTYIIGEGPYYIEALVISDTPDPDLSNNYDIAYYGGEEASAANEEVETLHATGNPIAMALLALLAIGAGGIKRRF